MSKFAFESFWINTAQKEIDLWFVFYFLFVSLVTQRIDYPGMKMLNCT